MTDRTLQTLPSSAKENPEKPELDTRETAPRRRGRRPSHAEHWTKVTVVLFDRQVVFLDRLVGDIRAASGAALSRAHVIRALVDALAESDVDLTGPRSERDLHSVLKSRLRHQAEYTAR